MSDFAMTFSPINLSWIIFATAFLSFVIFLWFEIKKKQKFLIARITALVLILIAVLGLILQPSLRTEKKSEAVLLTSGFEKNKLDSLLRANSHLKIFRTDDANSYSDAEVISRLNLNEENIRYILGVDLPDFYLEQLQPFQFIPCSLPNGITELIVHKVFANRKNSIEGVFYSDKKTKLKLIGATGTEDSLSLKEGSNHFVLSFRPKQSGLFIYNLASEDEQGNKSSERLPIEVVDERGLRILFIQKFPTAEVKQLKNFLADRGHSVAVRTQTSKNNFNEEFVNSSKMQLSKITNDLLSSFDLLLIDSKSIVELSGSERSVLQKSIFGGLGLIVFQNEVSVKPDFFFVNGKTVSSDTVHVQLPTRKQPLQAVPILVNEQNSIKPIIKAKNRVLAGYRFYGAGKIAFQFLRETYRVALEGSADDYAYLWTSLIEATARKKFDLFEMKMKSSLPIYPNEPIKIDLISSGDRPVVYSDGIAISAGEDALVDDLWHTESWAGKSGWHHFTANDSIQLNYFVHEPHEWKSLRTANLIRETSLTQRATKPQVTAVQFEKRKISPLVFFLIFLLASGFLWLAPKI